MKSASRIGNHLLAVTFLLSGAITLGSLSQADAQTPIKIGIISPTFGHAPFYIAREKGFYKAEGLIGEVIVMNRDDLILQSLVSDSIQFGNISPSAVFPARDQGLTDVKMIAGSSTERRIRSLPMPNSKLSSHSKAQRLRCRVFKPARRKCSNIFSSSAD